MSKDSYEDILVEELKALRETIEHLQRNSLNRAEAEDLNQVITKGQADMLDVSKAVEAKIKDAVANAVIGIEGKTIDAAKNGAVGAIRETREESLRVAQELSDATGEARKQAWRYFGGFWVWLAAAIALGAFLGTLATVAMQKPKPHTQSPQEACMYPRRALVAERTTSALTACPSLS